MKVVYLEISTWAGLSFDGEHYYGRIISDDRQVNLTKPMTAADAKHFNRKDPWDWNEGDLTERFKSKAELLALGLRTWKEHFPDGDILILGRRACAEPQTVLDGPEGIKVKLNALVREVEEIEASDPMRRSMSFDWDRLDELCEEWRGIMEGETAK